MVQDVKDKSFFFSEFVKLIKGEPTDQLDEIFRFISENIQDEPILMDKLNFSLQVGKICMNEINLDSSALQVCILYHCLPNEKHDIQPFKDKLDTKTLDLYNGLRKIPDIKPDKLNINAENFIKLLITITPDIQSILIKLAIVLYELRQLKDKHAEYKIQISTLVSRLFAPIAHRLGLYAIKTEMEDLSMKFLHPEIYLDIAKKLEDTKERRNKYIEEFIAPIKKELAKNHIPCEIKGRPKSIFSIWNKMRTQKVDFDEVYDQFAIRVIVDSKPENEKTDCWRVYSIITDWYKPNPLRLRDWISSPKSSGYESLHTTVIGPEQKWVEVQIRTQRMDEIAEKGQAAHWKYKEKKANTDSDWMSKIRSALENSENTENQGHDKNKAMLYTDEIFIFTPEGDLRKLRTGYTVLDFAFSIHSDVGETCTGAIVNNKFVSIKQTLKNGDHVKILTAKNQYPKQEWLEFAKGQRAINKIKRALKSQSYKNSDVGKDLLKHKLDQLKISYNDLNINFLVEYFKLKTALELYEQIGSGKIEIHKIKKAFTQQTIDQEKAKLQTEPVYSDLTEFEKRLSDKDELIIENNLQTIDYHLARCCNPIPGDEIFGFVTVSKGTKIHKKECSNAHDLMSRYPYRVIKARWNKDAEVSKFMVQIRITGRDNVGVTSTITQIIANEFNLNLRGLTIHPRKDNKFEGIIVTTVNDKKQLDDLISRLKRVNDILSVERVGK